MKPTKKILEFLYTTERKSPEAIALDYKVSGRTIRNWMKEFNIPRLGASHTRKGKSATWNIGIKRSTESKEKNSAAHIGKKPPNYGKGRVSFTCEVCGKTVFDKPYRRKRTCSKKCKDTLSEMYRGELHWNYKGDSAGFIQRKRNWSKYREWRYDVIKKSGYSCAKCKKTGGALTAHHIKAWHNNADARFDVSNGVCMCWNCHKNFHKKHGYRNVSINHLTNYLTQPFSSY